MGFLSVVWGRSMVCNYRGLPPSRNERRVTAEPPRPCSVCALVSPCPCGVSGSTVPVASQQGSGCRPRHWLAASPQGLQLAPATTTKGLWGTALPAGLHQPCPGTRRPAIPSVSGRWSEKPASVLKGKNKRQKEQLLQNRASTTRRVFRLKANKKQTENLQQRKAKPYATWNFLCGL